MLLEVSESNAGGKRTKLELADTSRGKVVLLRSYNVKNGSQCPSMAYDGAGLKEFMVVPGYYKRHLEPENGFARVEAEPVRDKASMQILEEELKIGFDGYVLFW